MDLDTAPTVGIQILNLSSCLSMRRDSTDGKAAALHPEDPGSNPVIGIKKHVPCCSLPFVIVVY